MSSNNEEWPKVSFIEEDGHRYRIREFRSGGTEKVIWDVDPDTIPTPEPELTETEEQNAELYTNVEYLVALQELELS